MVVTENTHTSDIERITRELNLRAGAHSIGALQELRARRKGLAKRPGSALFSRQTIAEEWAFHHGGRTELQFNIGVEEIGAHSELRYGVAFSFETSQSLPSIDVLVPKVRRFNEFVRQYPDALADLRMWSFKDDTRSSDTLPGGIPHELVTPGVFVFLGTRQPLDEIDYEAILGLFDRLLPLYEYVEGDPEAGPVLAPSDGHFTFRAGCSAKPTATTATPAQRELDIALRHNALQQALYHRLVEQYGAENVGTEIPSGNGTKIDVVVQQESEYWFFEIKTAGSARARLREAIGQLLEYAFWPGAQSATRLIIVGESPADEGAEEYLGRLRTCFHLPVAYEQIAVTSVTPL